MHDASSHTPFFQMLELAIQNLRQGFCALDLAKKTVPIVERLVADFQVGEVELGVVFLELCARFGFGINPLVSHQLETQDNEEKLCTYSNLSNETNHGSHVFRAEAEDEVDDLLAESIGICPAYQHSCYREPLASREQNEK
jgi:hypothetical protein